MNIHKSYKIKHFATIVLIAVFVVISFTALSFGTDVQTAQAVFCPLSGSNIVYMGDKLHASGGQFPNTGAWRSISLSTGTYSVKLAAWDDPASWRNNPRYYNQTQESIYAQVQTGSGTQNTGATGDIPENVDYKTATVATGMNITSSSVSIRAVHAAPASAGSQSVYAACAQFVKTGGENPPPPPPPTHAPTVSLSASPSQVDYNNTSTLSWNTTNADSCTASNAWSGSKAISGSENTGNLTSNKTYTLTCNGPGGSASDSATVTVSAQQSIPSVATNAATNVFQTSATLNGFVDPNGSNDTTRWFEWGLNTSLGNTTNQTSQGGGASNFSDGLSGLSNNSTYYFRAVAKNSQGTVYGSILSFTTVGGGSQLPTANTQSASTGNNFAVLNCFVDPNGSNDTTRWFEWGTNGSSLNSQTTHRSHGSSASVVSDTVSGLSPNTTYYYRCVAQNSAGISYGGILSFFTAGSGGQQPFVFTNNATNITQGSATLNGFVNTNNTTNTTRWFEWGPTTSLGRKTNTISHGSASSNISDVITGLSNNSTYYFRAVAQNNFGTSYGNILNFRTGQGTNNNAPTVVTNTATNVGQTSARLNGIAFVSNNIFTNGWFEWGLTASLGVSTASKGIGSSSSINYSASLFALSPNTTYYFRAIAQNRDGIARGSILSFRTNSIFVPPPPGPKPQPKVRDASITKTLENLDESNGTQTSIQALRGQTTRYIIEARNTGDFTLNEVEIKDRIPFYLEFANAERQLAFDDPQREVVWFVGDMAPGESRRVTLDVIITDDAPLGTSIVNIARIESERITRNSNEVIIRVTDNITNTIGTRGGTGNAAAVFFGGAFFPTTLLGWLLLIIFILVLIVLIRMLVGYYDERKQANDNGNSK